MSKNARPATHNSDGRFPTFLQRGIHLPFQHPYLAGARLRTSGNKDPRDWESVIPSISARKNCNYLIIPWNQLPSYASLGKFDQNLHAQFTATGKIQDIDPLSARHLTLSVTRTHGKTQADRDLAAMEIDRTTKENSAAFAKLFALVIRAYMKSAGCDQLHSLEDIETMIRVSDGGPFHPEQQQTLNLVTTHIMESYGLSKGRLSQRVETLAAVLSPFLGVLGSDLVCTDGVLIRLYCQLREVHNSIGEIVEVGGPLYANAAAMALFVTGEFINYTGRRLAFALQTLAKIDRIVTDWENFLKTFQKIRHDLAHAMDGWDVLLKYWHHALDEAASRDDGYLIIKDALAHVLVSLPLLPNDEMGDDETSEAIWGHYDFLRAGVLGEIQDNFADSTPATQARA
jgi:hypothetical protein